jgi:CubicO group peptidase (beta-lactamase class C family)
MWWVATNGKHLVGVDLPDGSYSARGAGGHYILVVPKFDLVIVHRVNTDIPGQSVSGKEFGELVKRILAARTSTSSASGNVAIVNGSRWLLDRRARTMPGSADPCEACPSADRR